MEECLSFRCSFAVLSGKCKSCYAGIILLGDNLLLIMFTSLCNKSGPFPRRSLRNWNQLRFMSDVFWPTAETGEEFIGTIVRDIFDKLLACINVSGNFIWSTEINVFSSHGNFTGHSVRWYWYTASVTGAKMKNERESEFYTHGLRHVLWLLYYNKCRFDISPRLKFIYLHAFRTCIVASIKFHTTL